MKKIILPAIVAASFLFSCSSDDSERTNNNGSFSNDPVSGVVYGHDFTFVGGKASPINANGEDVLYIDLAGVAMDCDSDVETPIWIIVPAAVGDYTSANGASIQFSDDAAGSFQGSFNEHVKITSITDTTVKGQVMGDGDDDAVNSINGTFEVHFCGID
ncbi:hypothetical protein HYN59_17230 [Flavobacterium album]|uniref:Lipoprotein n=1 Tax=Flavobacterium album TaxID=2175091 RepID=A0A2S1R1Z6_9FLAO|nr:hypothetical protein [Flavobacterium album]AWH86743.1 hypothetical protein HYN59_17230 [Flavobacterium album]